MLLLLLASDLHDVNVMLLLLASDLHDASYKIYKFNFS
jgi:hypothetical protein